MLHRPGIPPTKSGFQRKGGYPGNFTATFGYGKYCNYETTATLPEGNADFCAADHWAANVVAADISTVNIYTDVSSFENDAASVYRTATATSADVHIPDER